MSYHKDWQSALKALYQLGRMWTNPVDADDHCARTAGLELVQLGFAKVTLQSEGYERLEITEEGNQQIDSLEQSE